MTKKKPGYLRILHRQSRRKLSFPLANCQLSTETKSVVRDLVQKFLIFRLDFPICFYVKVNACDIVEAIHLEFVEKTILMPNSQHLGQNKFLRSRHNLTSENSWQAQHATHQQFYLHTTEKLSWKIFSLDQFNESAAWLDDDSHLWPGLITVSNCEFNSQSLNQEYHRFGAVPVHFEPHSDNIFEHIRIMANHMVRTVRTHINSDYIQRLCIRLGCINIGLVYSNIRHWSSLDKSTLATVCSKIPALVKCHINQRIGLSAFKYIRKRFCDL